MGFGRESEIRLSLLLWSLLISRGGGDRIPSCWHPNCLLASSAVASSGIRPGGFFKCCVKRSYVLRLVPARILSLQILSCVDLAEPRISWAWAGSCDAYWEVRSGGTRWIHSLVLIWVCRKIFQFSVHDSFKCGGWCHKTFYRPWKQCTVSGISYLNYLQLTKFAGVAYSDQQVRRALSTLNSCLSWTDNGKIRNRNLHKTCYSMILQCEGKCRRWNSAWAESTSF